MDIGLWKACMELLLTILVPASVLCGVIYLVKASKYKRTDYAKQTHFPYWHTLFNLGKRGEYFTYECLAKLAGEKKFVFNCYIPKEDGTTTEIDVLMLHETGIYVFESKNYSGWIFGTGTQKTWTQTLPTGKGRSHKEHFLNPIIQNKGHLKWLKEYLNTDTLPFYSYIVFSERCTLKDIKLTSGSHYVVKRNDLLEAVQENISRVERKLTSQQIRELFDKLYPLSQVDEAQKQAHIEQIKEKYSEDTDEREYETENAMESENTVSEEKTQTSDDMLICPKCGGKLVKRISRRGAHTGTEFWGCSNYPKCRYIRSIEEPAE